MRFEPRAFCVIFGFVEAFDLKDDWPRAVIAASDHDAVVICPSVHDRAALKGGVYISADAVPGFCAGKFGFPVASEMPEIIFAICAFKNEFVSDLKAWAHAALGIGKVFGLEIGMKFFVNDCDFANMFHRNTP